MGLTTERITQLRAGGAISQDELAVLLAEVEALQAAREAGARVRAATAAVQAWQQEQDQGAEVNLRPGSEAPKWAELQAARVALNAAIARVAAAVAA